MIAAPGSSVKLSTNSRDLTLALARVTPAASEVWHNGDRGYALPVNYLCSRS